jgi:hypothetical protein
MSEAENKPLLEEAPEAQEAQESGWRWWVKLILAVPATAAVVVGLFATLRTPTGLHIVSTSLDTTYRPTLRVVLQNSDDAPAILTKAELKFESLRAVRGDVDASTEVRPATYTWIISADDVARQTSTHRLAARIEKKEPDAIEFILGFEQRNAVLTGKARLTLFYNDGLVVKSVPFDIRIENRPGDFPEFHFPDSDAKLVAALDSTDTPFELDQIIVELARRQVSSAAPSVQKLFSHPDPNVRAAAASYFARILDPAANAGLALLVESTDPSVRRAALQALEAEGPAAFSDIERLMGSKDAAVRDTIVDMCGRLVDDRCRELVRQALEDRGVAKVVDGDEVLVSAAAVRALARMGATGDADRIIRKLSDANLSVKLAAIDAISDLKLVQAIPDLRRMAATGPPAVTAEANAAIKTLRPTSR